MLSDLNMIIQLYKMKSAAHSVRLVIKVQLILQFRVAEDNAARHAITCYKWHEAI
jgi:hypothetical protein